jgi:hypothetical protein
MFSLFTVNSSTSNDRIRMFPIASRPIARTPMAQAPSANAPMATARNEANEDGATCERSMGRGMLSSRWSSLRQHAWSLRIEDSSAP